MRFEEVVVLVLAERRAMDVKWGSGRNLDALLWNAILGEEVGEVANAILEHTALGEAGAPHPHIRAEIIQVAAVCFAWLEGDDNEMAVEACHDD